MQRNIHYFLMKNPMKDLHFIAIEYSAHVHVLVCTVQ